MVSTGDGSRRFSSGAVPLLPVPRELALEASTQGPPATSWPAVTVSRSLPAQGYRIELAPTSVRIGAGDEAGAFYGRCTFDQLAHLATRGWFGGRLPVGTVVDWPDVERRGVMVDVSRDKVPTLDTLFALVDRLAAWKINHLELYMEHTFAYSGHEEVWAQADPYTADDIRALEAHCAAQHVELAANQNTLGHMERWLIHPRYRDLGIARGMVRNPFGMLRPASTLDPANPAALHLVRDLLGQLGDVFTSPRVHVGMDEPWELPAEDHGSWAAWASKLATCPEMDGKTMLVWGDMLSNFPDLANSLPEGTVVCEWGYEAGHPFGDRASALIERGIETWLCPGTSSWLSVVGRLTNAVDNTRSAADAAVAAGISSVMTTDWGDFGHLQQLPFSDPGLAAVAAFTWCARTNRHLDPPAIAALLDMHCYDDPAGRIGGAIAALGDVHTLFPLAFPNLSTLTLHLYLPQLPLGSGFTTGLDATHLDAVSGVVDTARSAVAAARPERVDGALVLEEVDAGADLVLLACDDARARLATCDGRLSSVPDVARQDLARRLAEITDRQRTLWLARNRAGGLADSLAWLDHLRDCYQGEDCDPDWAGPLRCL